MDQCIVLSCWNASSSWPLHSCRIVANWVTFNIIDASARDIIHFRQDNYQRHPSAFIFIFLNLQENIMHFFTSKSVWQILTAFPANTKYLYNICTTSAQRLRRWFNIVQMLYKCFALTGLRQYNLCDTIIPFHLIKSNLIILDWGLGVGGNSIWPLWTSREKRNQVKEITQWMAKACLSMWFTVM